jgi:hypothetical protein
VEQPGDWLFDRSKEQDAARQRPEQRKVLAVEGAGSSICGASNNNLSSIRSA